MIDLRNEEILTFSEAAAAVPGNPHVSTLYRWVYNGIRGVKLASAKVGGKRVTTREAIDRFIDATIARDQGASVPDAVANRKSHRRSERDLDRAGIR